MQHCNSSGSSVAGWGRWLIKFYMAVRISDGEISERRHLVGVGDIVGRRILLRLFFSKDTPAHPRQQCTRDATGTEDSLRTVI